MENREDVGNHHQGWKIPSKEVSFVSICCQDIWTIKKRRYGILHTVKNAVANPPEVTRSDKLRCNRATSCISIIGPRLFEDSLTVITRFTKQFLIFNIVHYTDHDSDKYSWIKWTSAVNELQREHFCDSNKTPWAMYLYSRIIDHQKHGIHLEPRKVKQSTPKLVKRSSDRLVTRAHNSFISAGDSYLGDPLQTLSVKEECVLPEVYWGLWQILSITLLGYFTVSFQRLSRLLIQRFICITKLQPTSDLTDKEYWSVATFIPSMRLLGQVWLSWNDATVRHGTSWYLDIRKF